MQTYFENKNIYYTSNYTYIISIYEVRYAGGGAFGEGSFSQKSLRAPGIG